MAANKLSARFQETLAAAGDDDQVVALVRTRSPQPGRETLERLRPMVSGEQLATRRSELLGLITERYGRGDQFRANLRNDTAEAHAPVLEAAPGAHSLWLADAIVVTGTRSELQSLARHERVARVEANPVLRIPRFLRTPLEDSPEAVDGSTWGLACIGAPETWGGLGRGEGVLVGHLDTGVDASHPALAGKVAAFQEFDAHGLPVPSAPHDTVDHGTHTAGTIVGRTLRGINIGVAPDARLVSALVLPGGEGTFAQVVAGMQWAIGQGVHVINMSLGGSGYEPLWNLPVLNTVQSGVVLVASIGNAGHGTSGGPGNDGLAIGVGASHRLDAVAGFSGGQTMDSVPWFGARVTYNKPDLVAPGVQVVSCVPGGGLAAFNGTSVAASHVTGAVALLQSAEPGLRGDAWATRAILLGTVEDFGEAGKDQRFGFGRVDARSSAAQAIAFC
ncbi:S8 family serine peptidase [Actinomadura barringtoniae]|uniref:S8 family serine peptidase n=1 Tax=Actinomadura barringtoniae TaxID=1427535 RepID=A0A939PHC8_9ACTN|nr:S8 family serine peptidase [Actinomadura barringtoniae]MBO2450123.1 S8 family serine peptidase [Actinomadura barringtoniae]